MTWTATPPAEDGWYWLQRAEGGDPLVALVDGGKAYSPEWSGGWPMDYVASIGARWWPEPLTPPPMPTLAEMQERP